MSSRVIFVGVVALLLNSAYLAGPADPSLFYVMNVLLHPVVGLILFALLARRLLLWSRAPRPPLGVAGVLTVAIGALLGVAVLVVGGTRPYRLVVHAHVALSVAGSTLLAIQAWRTASRQPRRAAAWSIRLALCGVLLAASAAVAARIERGAERREALRIQNPTIVPASMDAEGGGPKSPFFPSSADTNVRGHHLRRLFPDQRDVRAVPPRHLRAMEFARLTTFHRSTTSGTASRSSTCRTWLASVPPSGAPVATTMRCSSRTLRPPSQGSDRYARSPGRARLHLVPCHHTGEEHDGTGRISRSTILRSIDLAASRNPAHSSAARQAR